MQEKNRRSFVMPCTADAYVEDAAQFAKALTLGEMSRAGDYGNAMRRVSRKTGVGHSVLKNLHYGAPKGVDSADFERLGTAYGRQRKSGRTPVEVIPRTALGRILIRAADTLDSWADALVGEGAEGMKDD